MAKARTSAYQTAQARLQTTPRYLVRFLTPRAVGSGQADPFQRDFSTGEILAATRSPYPYVGRLAGNTQTIDHRTGTTSIGTFTIPLLDKSGLLTAYCADASLGLAGAFSATEVTALLANGNIGGYPDQGTLELVAPDGTKERIRYASLDKPGQRFLGITRGVDGTTARAWSAATFLHNGEQIRMGTRAQIRAGYNDLAEADFLLLGTFEVLERALAPDRVTWLITCADLQRKALTRVFIGASEKTPVALGPEHFATLALKVLLSTGAGTNGSYDVLAQANGAGIDQSLVDVATFEALATTVAPTMKGQFSIPSEQDALDWIRTQCILPLGAVLWVDGQGRLSVKRLLLTATAAESVATLDRSTLTKWTWQAGDRMVLNQIEVLYDFAVDPALPNNYARREQYRATTSITRYGRRPPLLLSFQGLRTDQGALSLLDDLASRAFQRWADPAPVLQVEVQYRTAHHLEVGDVVSVTHAEIPNLISGVRGLAGELMQVLDTRPTFGPEGRMILTLATLVRAPAPSGDVFQRNSFTLVSTAALPAPENFTAVQLEENVILTWKAVAAQAGPDSGAVQYEMREGSSWDGAKVIVADWAGVSYVIANVLDGGHTYRIRAFTKDAAGEKTYGAESSILLTTSGADPLRNIVIDRDEVALAFPGTKTGMAFIAELTPDALSNLAGLWFDAIPTRWFGDAAISGLWFRHVGDLIYESPALDKGKTGPTAVLLTLAIKATDAGMWFDSDAGRWFNTSPSDWFDAVSSAAPVTVEINRSNDNITYQGWQGYQDGATYDFRYIKFRVTIRPQTQTAWVRIETLRVVLDVPDVIKELKDESIPAAGKSYAFATLGLTFVNIPFVTITHKGGLINKVHIVKNLSLTGFDLELRDRTDALVAGTVDIKIQGY